jgi:hypothetical protein
MAYLSSTGDFGAFREKEEDWIQTHVSTCFYPFRVLILSKGKDPFKAWEALSGSGLGISELDELAITLLEIVCNTAGTERLFSNLKIRQTDRRARMTIVKLEKKAKVHVPFRCLFFTLIVC